MTPIPIGNQGGNNYVQSDADIKNATEIRDAHVEKSISNAVPHIFNAVKILDEYKPWKSIAGKTASSGTETTASSATSGTAAGTVAGKALPSLSILLGAKDMYQMLSNPETIHGDDFVNTLSGRYTENGAVQMGPIDVNGANQYGNNQRTASAIEGAFGGLSMGLGLGALTGGLGWLAAPALALGGLGLGLWKGNKQKHAIENRINNYMVGSAAYNKQSSAEAANQRIKNDFFNNHYANADKGLRKCDDGLAFVNDREVVGQVEKDNDGKLHVSNAHAVSSPFGRADVKLENVDPINGFVIGHKIGPDGVELNEKALMYERMFNSPIPYLQKIGENGLLATLNTQDHTKKDNNPKPQYAKDIEKIAGGMPLADKGINMKKHSKGGSLPKYYDGYDALRNSKLYNIASAATLSAAAYNQWANAKNKPATKAPLIHVDDPGEQDAINRAGAVANINSTLDEILRLRTMRNYSIDNSPATSGQKMLLRSQTNKDVLDSIINAYSKKYELDQQARLNQANMQATMSRGRSQRLENALANQYNWTAQAAGKKDEAENKYFASMFAPIAPMFENMSNNAWQLAMMNLYQQKLTNEQKDMINASNPAQYVYPTFLGKLWNQENPYKLNYKKNWRM